MIPRGSRLRPCKRALCCRQTTTLDTQAAPEDAGHARPCENYRKGQEPADGLSIGAGGHLFGETTAGGTKNNGVVFELVP